MEYSTGMVRVLLGRGAGRLRLLLAKLTVLALLGVVLLAGFLALVSAAVALVVIAWTGSTAALATVPRAAWTDLGIDALIALASMAVCVLVGAAAAVTGRSLAFGIPVALALFPADNFAIVVLGLLRALTGQQLWLDASAYLLGPSLNVLPVVMETDHRARAAFAGPLVHVDAAHAWLVVGAWTAALAAVAVTLTWRRDVLE
jgi:hypothetical protein